MNFDIIDNINGFPDIKDLNQNFQLLLKNIQDIININIVYTNVLLKLKEPEVPKINEKIDIFDLGVERTIKDSSLIIWIYRDYKNFLPIILLREAFYCFLPNLTDRNQTIRIIINLIVEFELEKFEHINEWKQIFHEEIVEFSINSPFFHIIDKFLKPDGQNLSENSIRFLFNYIRNNIQSITEAKDTFFSDLIKDYILKTSRAIFDDDMVESIRILIKIFYEVRKYRAFIDYKDYFKEFIQNKKIKTYLSLRRFSESVNWINKFSFIAPSYELNWHLIGISWLFCSLTFHPSINKRNIDRVMSKFPFISSPHSSSERFSYKISFWMLYPRVFENDTIHFIERLENNGYIIDKTLVLLKKFKNNSINLNYFRDYYIKSRLINPRHQKYNDKYEISFEHDYEFRPTKKLWDFSILDARIFENISLWAIQGIGFESRSGVNRLMKSRIIHEILSRKYFVKNIRKKIRKIQNNKEIKQFLNILIQNNKKNGFFYIVENLEGVKRHLKIINKILVENPDIGNLFKFQEHIKKHYLFNKLDDALLFDRIELKDIVLKRVIKSYFEDINSFRKYQQHINTILDFFYYCDKLKILNLNAIKRIVEDKSISENIYIQKQEKLERLQQNYRHKEITREFVDNRIDEFCNANPPLLVPYVINTLNTSNFAKYFLRFILKYSTETIELLSKIKHYFPRFSFDIGIDPFTNEEVIFLAIYLVNLSMEEKEILLSIFSNLFEDEIINIKRYFFDGFYDTTDLKAYYDLDTYKFFYTKDLFEQFFNYTQKVFGDKLKKFKEVPFEKNNLIWSLETSFDNLINHVEDRLSRQHIDFNIKLLQGLEEFQSKIKNSIINIDYFKQTKQFDFFKQYIKSIKFIPNFHRHGLSQYFLYIRPLDMNQIDFKLLFTNTFQKIKFEASIDRSQLLFISYLFPFRNPNMAYINWLTKSKRNINEYCIFFIKTVHVIFNFYKNLEFNGWNLDYKEFETHIQQILFNPDFRRQPLKIETFQLSETSASQFLGRDTPDFIKLNNIYKSESIDIKSIIGTKLHTKEKDIIDLLKKDHIFPYLKLKNLDFQDKIYIILIDLDKETIDKLIRVFNFFNYGFIYEIEGEYFMQGLFDNKRFENGLMIKLYLPLCEISAFLRLMKKSFHILGINNYLILNDLVNGKRFVESVYDNLDFLKKYNPLMNLIWNKRDNKWLNHKLFNENFDLKYPDLIHLEEDIDN